MCGICFAGTKKDLKIQELLEENAVLKKIYDRIVAEGLEYHINERQKMLYGGIHTRKRYAGHNLLLRLKNYRYAPNYKIIWGTKNFRPNQLSFSNHL